jgi:hypothetical protein
MFTPTRGTPIIQGRIAIPEGVIEDKLSGIAPLGIQPTALLQITPNIVSISVKPNAAVSPRLVLRHESKSLRMRWGLLDFGLAEF